MKATDIKALTLVLFIFALIGLSYLLPDDIRISIMIGYLVGIFYSVTMQNIYE